MRAVVLLLLAIGLASPLLVCGAPSTNKVLILSTTVTTGMAVPGGCYECAAVLAAGLVPEIVTPVVWLNMTGAQFGKYRAIVLGDATCTTLGSYAAASANPGVWIPQITGDIVLMGSDPVYHVRFTNPAINQWNLNAVNVAVADPTKVGAYISLSCAYDSVAPGTPIPWLSSLGGFTARGVSCSNDAHIVVASSPALVGLTDSTLSSWSCSVHNGFDLFPATFIPLAIARGLSGSGMLPFADGSSGVPYVLIRGGVPVLCGDGILQATEQCDNGALNGVLGQPCSVSCRLNWCGDGVLNVGNGEQCDGGVNNGAPGSSCDSGCVITGPMCVGGCGLHGHCVYAADNLHSRCLCDDGWAGPQCNCNVPSYHLSTDHPPKMDVARSGVFAKDMLTLLVNVSSKYYDTVITFKNERNLSCNFPASTSLNLWTSQFFGPAQCEWSHKANIPWGFAWNQCIWYRDETANYITFSGEMDVGMTEDLAPIRGVPLVRTHIHTLPFSVVFPKYVSVTAPVVTVYTNQGVLAAIVEQHYSSDLAPNGRGAVKLFTSVQWPYQLQGPIAASSANVNLPVTVTGPAVVVPSVCVNDASHSACRQYFDFVITPAPNQCNLNTAYTFTFMVGCQAGVAVGDCPLLAPASGNIVYTLESSYICQQVIANIDLSATMTTYSSSSYTVPKSGYALGLTGYYYIHTASTMITIDQTTVSTIVAIAPNGTTIQLYNAAAGGNTAAGNWVSLAVNNAYAGKGSPSTDDTFSLTFAPSFFDVPADSFSSWSFAATVNVVFRNTQPASADETVSSTSSSSYAVEVTSTSADGTRYGVRKAARPAAKLTELDAALVKYATMDAAPTTGKNLVAQANVLVFAKEESPDPSLSGAAAAARATIPATVTASLALMVAIVALF